MSNISSFQTQQITTSANRAEPKPSAMYGDKTKATNAADFFGMLLASLVKPATGVATPTDTAKSTDDTASDMALTAVVNSSLADANADALPTDDATELTDVLWGATWPADGDAVPTSETPESTTPLQTVAAVVDPAVQTTPTPDATVAAKLAVLDETMPPTDVDYELARQTILAGADAGDDAIVTDPTNDTGLSVKTAVATTAPTGPLPDNAQPDQDIAAQLNAMTVGTKVDDQDGKGKDKPVDILSAILQGMKSADADGYQPTLTPSTGNYVAGGQKQAPSPLATMPFVDPTLSPSTPMTQTTWVDPMVVPVATSASSQTSVASTSAASVGGSHTAQAAVQAVAVHLQSLGQNKDTRSLTLQLNPPELGKMQIKMTYGRDKSVKADILVEKSDTYNMMQRDANTLRDALSNAGLNADAGSLNFTLADQGTFQNRDNTGAFGDMGARATGDDTIAAFEIKSSEEWSVDPSTGITRYNIWA